MQMWPVDSWDSPDTVSITFVPFCSSWVWQMACTAVGGGPRSLGKIPLRIEPERPLDEGTEWVVGHSTETVDSSPSTESMDSWAASPWIEQWTFLYLELQRMSLYPSLSLRTVPSTWLCRPCKHSMAPPPPPGQFTGTGYDRCDFQCIT